MATLECSPAVSTIPISPSGATTGSNSETPSPATAAQQQGAAVGRQRLVQNLRGHVWSPDPPAERQEVAQALVLGQKGGKALRQVGRPSRARR